jgi:hypothetical protein
MKTHYVAPVVDAAGATKDVVAHRAKIAEVSLLPYHRVECAVVGQKGKETT